MARLRDLSIDNTADGRRLLRFTTIIVNVGPGLFELHGSRASTLDPDMDVTQRIYNDTGGYRDVVTTAAMYYAGDGHNHWHVRDLETYELKRLDNGVRVGTGAKHGFCFNDNTQSNLTLPGAPPAPVCFRAFSVFARGHEFLLASGSVFHSIRHVEGAVRLGDAPTV